MCPKEVKKLTPIMVKIEKINNSQNENQEQKNQKQQQQFQKKMYYLRCSASY